MTLEEIKAEAEKLGYNVVKKQKYIALKPCPCGKKKPTQWFKFRGGILFICDNCKLESNEAKTKKQARINWNNLVSSKEI